MGGRPQCVDGGQSPDSESTKALAASTSGVQGICSLVTSGTGRVYHRGSLPLSSCGSSKYRDHMAKMISRRGLGEGGAIVSCCSQSGCNWNRETATGNIDINSISLAGVGVGVAGSWPWVVLVM